MSVFELCDVFAEIEKKNRKQRRGVRAISLIEKVLSSFGLNKTELAVAMGKRVPDVGQPGSSAVSRWSVDGPLPDDSSLKFLELTIQGIIRFRFLRKEGTRRRIFEPYIVKCPRLVRTANEEELHQCSYAMRRRGGREVCDTCLHEMPAVNQDDLVIDVEAMNLEGALRWVAPETEIVFGEGEVTFKRFRHDLTVDCKTGRWDFASSNRLGMRHWGGERTQSSIPRLELHEGAECDGVVE